MKLTRRRIVLLTAAFTVLLVSISFAMRCASSRDNGFGFSFPTPSGNPQILSVRSYGAKGDGSTDDRVAITTAMTAACAAGAQELFFPPGTYNVSRSGSNPFALDVTCDNLTLRGVHGKSIIRHPAGMPNAQVDVIRVNLHRHIIIRDLVVDGNWGNCVARITLSSNNVALSGASTINVDDASCFPAGTFGALVTDTSGPEYLVCTGKTATTLTGCTGSAFAGGAAIGTLFVDQRVGYVDFQAGINHTTQTSHVTAIASGSNGDILPQATINVDATFSYTSGDDLLVKTSMGYQKLSCTGTSGGNQFTGCTGGTGTLATNNEVFNSADPKNMGLRIRGCEDVTVQDVDVRNVYGDCIALGTGTSGGIAAPDRNIRISNVTCRVAARDGISMGSGVDGVRITNLVTQDIISTAIDAEPVQTYVRSVDISHSTLDGWFSLATHGGGTNVISLVGGLDNDVWTDAQTAWSWHVHDNTLNGTVLIERAGATVIENNAIRPPNISGGSTILVEFSSQTTSILNNTVYAGGTTGGLEGGGDIAAIQAWSYQSGTLESAVSSMEIAGNYIHATNGRHGVSVKGGGNHKLVDSGTATGVTSTTLTDTTKTWTTNEWVGSYVRMGSAVAIVDTNTSTVLTLTPALGVSSVGWVDGIARQTATPSAGAYTILLPTGIVSIHDNHIDLTNDGKGKGKYGINITNGSNNDTGTRVAMVRNHIKNCDTHAIRVKFDATTAYPLIEISDNDAHDDQPTATCLNMIRADNALKATKLIIGGNALGEGMTGSVLSNISAGSWIVRDGPTPQWAGYGSPESAVTAPIGSTYQRVDGTGPTSFYTKATGTGNTGWLARGSFTTIAATDHIITQGSSPALTSCGTGPAIVGDDNAGTITEGTIATGCVVTWATAYSTAPSCVFTSEAALGFTLAVTNTAATITNVGALSSTKLDYVCHGH